MASTPTTSASSTTEPSTWARVAPMARSSADSRLRWAATIENVLWMLNEATSRATPAKTSSIVRISERKSSSMPCSCSALSAVAGDRLDADGERPSPTPAASSSWLDAGLGGDAGSRSPRADRRRAGGWRRSAAKPVKVLPAMLSDVPKATMPTISTGTWSGTSTVVVSPTASSPVVGRAAVDDDLDRAAVEAACGARPSTIR